MEARAISHHPSEQLVLQFDTVAFSYGQVSGLDAASSHTAGDFRPIGRTERRRQTTVLKLVLGLAERQRN